MWCLVPKRAATPWVSLGKFHIYAVLGGSKGEIFYLFIYLFIYFLLLFIKLYGDFNSSEPAHE